jgi:diacylglycerol kinase (ATP)
MEKKGKADLSRLYRAFIYSMKGIKSVWEHEAAFRQEIYLFIFQVPAAFFLGTNWVERSLLIGSCIIVLITELLNSAVEAVVDRFGSEHHELSGRAKDMGSAAVFFSLLLNVFIWASSIISRFFSS